LIRILFIGQQKITYNEVKSQGEQLLSTFLRGFFPANIDTRALQTQTETATKTNKIQKKNDAQESQQLEIKLNGREIVKSAAFANKNELHSPCLNV